ncbi:hypothetical protein [Xanthomonas euvesicatoria]|uniref:hypothetical protein n=1 Tax=Xanthomonas euvesicatoria TaxID=456327 RepID=UPI001C452441|nr:hypothetical protein [Xanthomonas euvesicatoria]MBV6847842.1 hypothetical protein [Xanthomonas campestris pv. heliotropii]
MDIMADWFDTGKLIGAAETEDEIGTVLRMHLALDKILNHFLHSRITSELAPYVRLPGYTAQKIALAAAFGMPVPFLAAAHEINRIRNGMAHDGDVLAQDKVDQLARQVNSIQSISPSFHPLAKRYIEFSQLQPGKRFTFGTAGARFDFLIATFALITEMAQWLISQRPPAAV